MPKHHDIFTPNMFDPNKPTAELIHQNGNGENFDKHKNEYDANGNLISEAKSEEFIAIRKKFPTLSPTDERFKFELRRLRSANKSKKE